MSIGILQLAVSGVFIILLTAVLYKTEKRHKSFTDKNRWKWQLAVGIIYGLVAVCGTEFGVQIEGAVMNIRDAAPLCAGLFFGAPAGILAGCIGGIERWFAVYWGVGSYTRVACTLGTLIAGLFAAFVRKNILEDKKPGWIYALAIGMVTEVLHILLVFLTNLDDTANAINVVKVCTPIMIPLVTVTVGMSALLISVLSKEHFSIPHEQRKIVEDMQAGLLITVLITFILTNAFVVLMQDHLAQTIATNTIGRTLKDVQHDVEEADVSDEDVVEYFKSQIKNWHIGTTGYISVMDKDGYVVAVTDGTIEEEYVGTKYDMPKQFEYGENTVFKRDIAGSEYYCSYIYIDGFLVAGMYPAAEANLSRNVSIYTTAFFEIIILAVLFLQIYFLIRVIVVKNLKNVNESLAKISSGNLDTRVEINSNAEFVSLSRDINTTVDALKHYIEEAASRIDAELQFAKDIQYSALPRVYPDSNKIDLYANMLPAKEVGGDFYDFYLVGEDKISVLIADVSGKGIPASLFMMKSKTLIKSLVESGASPEVVFANANNELCANNEAEMFVTAWLGIMDLNTGEMEYVSAGHNPPIVLRANGEAEYLRTKSGFVLGGIEDVRYRKNTLTLEKGDVLYLYTDGVTEATNERNELFGEDRLLAALRPVREMNMRYLCKFVKSETDEFVGTAPQFDDITMLALKRKSDEDQDSYIETKPTEESMADVVRFFEKFIEEHNVSMKLETRIMIIVDEVYSNIVRYSGATKSKVCCRIKDERLLMSFEDNGIAYNPLEKEDPNVTLNADDREIGGLGIFMVKEMTEDVQYGRINNKNILDVVIKL